MSELTLGMRAYLIATPTVAEGNTPPHLLREATALRHLRAVQQETAQRCREIAQVESRRREWRDDYGETSLASGAVAEAIAREYGLAEVDHE